MGILVETNEKPLEDILQPRAQESDRKNKPCKIRIHSKKLQNSKQSTKMSKTWLEPLIDKSESESYLFKIIKSLKDQINPKTKMFRKKVM